MLAKWGSRPFKTLETRVLREVEISSTDAAAKAAPAELTVRAVATGMVVGALLTPCNVYSGLKIGWTFNMSVAAGLIGFAFWSLSERWFSTPALGLKENNINQTAASSAASIISAGLAAPIPALALLTGQTLTYPVLALWMFVVSALGIVVAAGLRNQLLFRENLPFPAGVVAAETMQELHASGREAGERLRLLAGAAASSAALKIATTVYSISQIGLPFKISVGASTSSAASSSAPAHATALNLGFALDPSLLMVGFGAISGLRIGVSALIGAVIGWGVLAPMALRNGWVELDASEAAIAVWYGPLVEWLLWPGATLMVTAAFTSFAISMVRLAIKRKENSPEDPLIAAGGSIPARLLIVPFLIALVMAVAAQSAIFGIGLFEGVLAVFLSYALAVVAARVTGETGITPIGALGKITQFTFAAVSPGNMTANLMTANVTGGSAGQCADLMHDLRTGQMVGATPGFQVIAQVFGVLTGSLVAALAYIALIPNPVGQLLTAEWPAPAVATWKAVAEVLSEGVAGLPEAAVPAVAIAALVGIVLALVERLAPVSVQAWTPSASAIGLAFVIPAWNSISLFAGALLGAVVLRLAPEWAKRQLVVIAAGLIVGESLAGIIPPLIAMFW